MFSIIGSLIIGGFAGYFASKLTNTNSDNLIQNIVLGLIGGIVGEFLASLIGLGSKNFIGSLVLATIGAIIVLWIYNKFIKK